MAKVKVKVVSGGWVDTPKGQQYPKGAILELDEKTVKKFVNTFERVEDVKAKVTAPVSISAEPLTEETVAEDAPAAPVAQAEPKPVPEGAEDATEMFENDLGIQVFQMADASFLIRVPGEEDDQEAEDADEVNTFLKEKAEELAPKKKAKKKK